MAKYECMIKSNIDEVINAIETDIMNGSLTASIEERSDFVENGARCSVRIFERYSVAGSNRLSLNVTMFQANTENVFVSATSAGGSQAMLFKLNTLGEEAFVGKFRESLLKRYGTLVNERKTK